MTEIQRYEVVKNFGDFEIRRYEPHALVSVLVPGSLAEASNRGFAPLFSYIGGANQLRQAIPMTAPVIEAPAAGGYEVSFVMPAGISPDDVPAPQNAALKVKLIGSTLVAASQFSGLADEAKFHARGQKLEARVIEAGLQPVGQVFYARYNSPFTPGFLRRNEALLEISDSKAG